jgi:chromatin structure-remodeling complex protein RSC7
VRKANLDGVYDTHTNMMFYPTIMQPTHARWEQIPPPEVSEAKALTNGLPNGHHTINGSAEKDIEEEAMEIEEVSRSHDAPHSSIFTPVPAIISRNFSIIDTQFVAPSLTSAGYPGPDGQIVDPTSGPNGLASIANEILDELPEDCRQALEEAKRTEMRWKTQWGSEAQSALRGDLKIGLNGYPV